MPKGNHRATGKKAGRAPELAQQARAIILRAMDIINDDYAKTLPELVAEKAAADPIKFMELVSKYIPKDLHVEGNQTVEHRIVRTVDRPGLDTATWAATDSDSASTH